ncbi:MAG: lytic transglycosylase domain-containing protein [Blastocatellia bacterium]|nr:lytic transglycosylase domain-containing protein [Blastocatellia bacterium]
MKVLLTAIIAALFCSLHIAAQSSPRVFDNFDRSQGVQVYTPPPSPVEATTAKTTRRVRRNGRWIVEVVDTPPLVTKTAAVTPAAGYARIAMGSNKTLKGFTTGNAAHDKHIEDASRKYNIDPLLIYAQMHQESAFKIRATSHKGASGLMQLMPATARRFGVTSIYDPKQNIEAGVRYMRWLLDYFGQDVVLALAGYNAGEGAVLRYGRNVPPFRETREYVRRISARYNSISNPTMYSSPTPNQQVAQAPQSETRPLTVFEPMPLTVRLPDGKLILVSQ